MGNCGISYSRGGTLLRVIAVWILGRLFNPFIIQYADMYTQLLYIINWYINIYTVNICLYNSCTHIERWISLVCNQLVGRNEVSLTITTQLLLVYSSGPLAFCQSPSISEVLRVSSCLFMIRFVLAAASIISRVHEWERCPTSGHDSSASPCVMVIPSMLLLLHNCPRKAVVLLGSKFHCDMWQSCVRVRVALKCVPSPTCWKYSVGSIYLYFIHQCF